MFGAVPKLAEGSQYEVTFPAGAAAITDTVYDISAEGLIKVMVGRVSVAYGGDHKTQIVLGEQMFDVRTGILQPLPEAGRSLGGGDQH